MAPSRHMKAAVIPLHPQEDEDVEYVKHRRSEANNGVTEEIQLRVPKLKDDSSPYRILQFFTTFTQVRCHMEWTTGPRLFQRFHIHLEGVHFTTWEEQVIRLNETVVNFDVQYIEFKGSLLQGYPYLNQMDYLCTVKKTKDQTPKEYLRLVHSCKTLACQLPDAQNQSGFSNMECRCNFFQAMPMDCQSKFIEANMRIEDETLVSMRIYFERLQELYPFEEISVDSYGNHNCSSRSHNRGCNQSRRGGNSRRRNDNNANNDSTGNGGQGNQNNGRNNRNNRGTRHIQNMDQCPLPGHDGRTRGKCQANKYNDEWVAQNQNNGNQCQRSESNNAEQTQNTMTTTSNRNNQSNQSNRLKSTCNYDNFYFALQQDDIFEGPESILLEDGFQDTLEEGYEIIGAKQAEIHQVMDEQKRMMMVPSTLAIAKKINDQKVQCIYKALLDHGGSHILIKPSALSTNQELFPVEMQSFTTAAGGLSAQCYVWLHDLVLPEFSYSRRVKLTKAFVFDNDDVIYDIILLGQVAEPGLTLRRATGV